MLNERCSAGQHNWICKQIDGAVGEITSERILSEDEIKDILADKQRVNSVCMNGVIICKECNQLLFGEQSKEEVIDFKNLESKLIK